MGQQTEAQPEGQVPESDEWVTGEGGPSFSQAGMSPGGSDMENWKAQPAAVAERKAATGDPVPEQGEGLLDRLQRE